MAGRVGVLALQGAFREHIAALRGVDVDAVEVRLPRDLEGLDGLVIPGGESSTMSKLIEAYDLEAPIRELHARGGAFLGTCAGMIVLAHHAADGRPDQRYLDMIDIDVRRNAYGRQPASFEAPLRLVGEDLPIPGVFIRAPQIERLGDGVEVVAEHEGEPVAARQGNVLVTAFHPELTSDRRLHRRFAEMAGGREEAAA
ncbi:MAG TPA: pyridoxal 5'-phosphate synthase glutaminase subunit PdxT [Gaiellales bacterium]|nr:pyridoxal 5'-phosphate synthase glutaminase subunit PdxT [Gaiellales bacterium]